MADENKPWLGFYSEDVDPDIDEVTETLAERFETVFARFPDRAAFHFMGASYTFGQLNELSDRFAAFLTQCGCSSGNAVGINLPNIPEYLIALVGAQKVGCIVTGVSPLLSPKEMAYQLNDADVKVLVTLDAIFEQRLTKIKDDTPNLEHVVATNIGTYMPWLKRFLGRLLKKIPTGTVTPLANKSIITFSEALRAGSGSIQASDRSPGDTALVMYTGGTTGLPKGAELTHKSVLTNLDQVTQWLGLVPGEETFISAFPLFHMAGLTLCIAAMASGGPQVLIPDPRNTTHICKEFRRYRPTIMANVPLLYQLLMADPMFGTLPFEQLRVCVSGAAAFPVESFRQLENIVGEGKVVEVYGMTETSPLLTMNPYRGTQKVGSVGVPVQSTTLKIVDLVSGTKELAPGEPGEVIATGPQLMKGYLNRPEETAHALREFQGRTWIYTGDVATMDEDGFFTVVDRSKDMLNVGGFKVFSKEVEESLQQLPAIEMCAVIGQPNPDKPGNDRVKAVIQLAQDHAQRDRDEVRQEILAHCKENMAPYKVPKVIDFEDALPLTPIGKLDKKVLRSVGSKTASS